MSESCKTCRFHAIVVDKLAFEVTSLRCRRYPPAVDANTGHVTSPRVRDNGWCGEYKALERLSERSPEPAGETAGVDAGEAKAT